MILEPVEFLQLGHRAQPAVQAVEVKQQARLVRLMIPPILIRDRLELGPTQFSDSISLSL